MKTIIILGLLQVCLYQTLAVFSPADWALEIKHNDPEADNDFINATEIGLTSFSPGSHEFRRNPMGSDEKLAHGQRYSEAKKIVFVFFESPNQETQNILINDH